MIAPATVPTLMDENKTRANDLISPSTLCESSIKKGPKLGLPGDITQQMGKLDTLLSQHLQKM